MTGMVMSHEFFFFFTPLFLVKGDLKINHTDTHATGSREGISLQGTLVVFFSVPISVPIRSIRMFIPAVVL